MAALWAVFPLVGIPGKVLICRFDGPEIMADRNDFGLLKPADIWGFRLTPPGTGCPANPKGRALDAGFSADIPSDGRLSFPIDPEADLRQGTVEFWMKPRWSLGAPEIHALFGIKLSGGRWNGIWLGHHGLISPKFACFGPVINDGTDHACYVQIGRDGKGLPWRAGEWHHVAFSWTGHTIWLWGDGKLLTRLHSPAAFRIGRNEGRLNIGFPRTGFGGIAGALIDEFRLCDVPLYVGEGRGPRPGRPVSADLGLGLAFLGAGARAEASSTAAPEVVEGDVPRLHNGGYGDAVRVGLEGGSGWAKVCLPSEAEVSAIEWSRDGRPYAGPKGQGWAFFMPLPLGFKVEVSLDGRRWRKVLEVPNFEVRPSFVASHTALRFRHEFEPTRAKFVKFTITRAPRGNPPMLLDEVAVFDTRGHNLALLPGAKVVTEMSSFERRYSPNFAIDGRLGEESCWKSGAPGKGVLTIRLPGPVKVSRIVLSRYGEWPAKSMGGTPTEGRIEASLDGRKWTVVARISGSDPGPREFELKRPVLARFLRVAIEDTSDGGPPVVDDLRVY